MMMAQVYIHTYTCKYIHECTSYWMPCTCIRSLQIKCTTGALAGKVPNLLACTVASAFFTDNAARLTLFFATPPPLPTRALSAPRLLLLVAKTSWLLACCTRRNLVAIPAGLPRPPRPLAPATDCLWVGVLLSLLLPTAAACIFPRWPCLVSLPWR